MADEQAMRSGGEILVDQLLLHGADLAFGVPGESYLAVLDALYERRQRIRFITCRHEAGAANMADAFGKLTGKPGICMVTRGPGACHAAIGLHTAFQDSTPMLLLIGQVGRDMSEREAFQEIDYRRMFGQSAKWVAEIDDAARIPEFVARAFATAVSGRPGPVVLALPEDVLRERVATPDALPFQAVETGVDPADMARFRDLLSGARRPFLLVGGGGWSAAAKAAVERFALAWTLPIGVGFRRQDYVSNDLAVYAGDVGIGINPALARRLRDSDLVIALGSRLGEATTSGYTLLEVPVPRQRLVHIHPAAAELGRVYQPSLAINASAGRFAAAAASLGAPETVPWRAWTESARADYLAWQSDVPAQPGPLDMVQIVRQLRAVLPDDAIVTNGAGNATIWLHRFFRWRRWRSQLAPANGAMGYGVPAAVAAAILHPDRVVVSLTGDGCFQMAGHELATAMQYGAKPIFLIVNNGMYGTIRMHQERDYPDRVLGTALVNPDFVAWARAFGAHAERVEATAEFAPALARAIAAGVAAVIELRIDPEALTPQRSLSQIRGTGAVARGRPASAILILSFCKIGRGFFPFGGSDQGG